MKVLIRVFLQYSIKCRTCSEIILNLYKEIFHIFRFYMGLKKDRSRKEIIQIISNAIVKLTVQEKRVI